MNRIYFAKSPTDDGVKMRKKTLGGTPKCFCYVLSNFLQVDTIENPARFQIFQVQSIAIDEDIRVRSAFFRQGNGTAVDVDGAVFHFTANGGVEMSVQK